MNVLHAPLIRVVLADGSASTLSLPGVLAALMADCIAAFPALRPHQRHAWHSFLAQLGAMALHAAGRTDPPDDASAWRDLLVPLTPGPAASHAWTLVAPPDQPALLQPPLPDGLTALKNQIATPDGLDMLVTAKNHDLKQAVMEQAQPDDWLFALLTLQTMEGFLGAGNYGISRMNGGSANRPALGLIPPGGPGAHVRRDVERLLALRGGIARTNGYPESGGLGLVWLAPWDGGVSLPPGSLDPLYIEVCRRVRLIEDGGRLSARAGSSKVARIIPPAGGVTGDPWAPLRVEKDGSLKVLTVDVTGFGYRRMVGLMFPGDGGRLAPLQEPAGSDPEAGLVLLARALVRGQGKTEGYHERRVPISRRVRRRMGGSAATDPIAQAARERVELAGEMQRRVLQPALLCLLQNGPERVDLCEDARIRPFLARFDHAVDRSFFEDLWAEIEEEGDTARKARRDAWVGGLLACARTIVEEADSALPKVAHRRYRARVRALDELYRGARRNGRISPHLPEKQDGTP